MDVDPLAFLLPNITNELELPRRASQRIRKRYKYLLAFHDTSSGFATITQKSELRSRQDEQLIHRPWPTAHARCSFCTIEDKGIWYCCQCHYGPLSIVITPDCLYCGQGIE